MRIKTVSSLGLVVMIGIGSALAETTGTVSSAGNPEKDRQVCRENLAKIDGSKEQFALEYKLSNGSAVTWQNILDPAKTGELGQGYLKRKPVCPSGGEYTLNVIGKDPKCSVRKEKNHYLDDEPDDDDETTATAPKPATNK